MKFSFAKTPLWQYVFCVISFLSGMFFVKWKVPFTNSGEITFYLVELLGLCVGVYLIVYVCKNFKQLTKHNKIIFWTSFVSQFLFLAIYVIRILTAGLEMKSILILECNLFVIGFLFLIAFRIIPAKTVMSSLSWFFAILGVLSVVIIFAFPGGYTDVSLFSCPLFDVLTFGNAVRTYLILICLPITALHYLKYPGKWSALCFYVQLAALTVCGMTSGARVNYICIPLAVVLLAVIFARFVKRGKWKIPAAIVSVFVLSIVAVFFVSQFSIRVYSQMMRLDVTRSVMKTCNIQYIGSIGSGSSDDLLGEDDNGLKQMLEQAEISAGESVASRVQMWGMAIEDIKSAPFFGQGLTQYQFMFANGTVLSMQAHNFILEYLLAFGLVGFVFWAVMILAPEAIVLKKIRFRFWNHAPICMAFCSMLFACCGAFFQPYFLYSNIMFFIFVMKGCYYTIADGDLPSEKSPVK